MPLRLCIALAAAVLRCAGQSGVCFAFYSMEPMDMSGSPLQGCFVEILMLMVALEDGQGLLWLALFGFQETNIKLLRRFLLGSTRPCAIPDVARTRPRLGASAVAQLPIVIQTEDTSSALAAAGAAPPRQATVATIRTTCSQAALDQYFLDAYVARQGAALTQRVTPSATASSTSSSIE